MSASALATAVPAGYSDRFLLTVHGVASTNDGLAKLRDHCEEELPGIVCDSYSYGRVYPYKELTEEVAGFLFRSIREKLELIQMKYLEKRELYVVAHSFGTLAVVRALEMGVKGLQVRGLVLLGSIVPRNFYWDALINRGQLAGPPLVVVRPRDGVVVAGNLVGGGASGAEGFISSGMHRALETYKRGGHLSYYPDDRDDVVTAISRGLDAVPRVNRETWSKSLSWSRKLWYAVT